MEMIPRSTLGHGGPEITSLGYGTWQAGGDWSESAPARAFDAIDAALDGGVNWIDTAEIYGAGASERLVAEVLRQRETMPLVFTKVAPRPAGSGLEPEQVRVAAERSLERLGADRVDLYQVHWFEEGFTDPSAISRTWTAMAKLVEDGLAMRIGISNATREVVERCMEIHPVASVQNEFSILQNGDRTQLLPWLREMGIAYLAYSPLASGLLSGAVTRSTVFDAGDWRNDASGHGHPLFAPHDRPVVFDAVEALAALAAELDMTLADLALRFVLSEPGVCAAILGSCNPRHIASSLACAEDELPADVGTRINSLIHDYDRALDRDRTG